MFKVFHFTDLHLRRAIPGHSGFSERLSRLVPHLLDKLRIIIVAEKPDLVVVTGDLLDVPHDLMHGTCPKHLEARAIDQVLADYTYLNGWLNSLEIPFLIVPGNHDLRKPFDQVFYDCQNSHRVDGWEAHAFPDWDGEDSIAERQGESLDRFKNVVHSNSSSRWVIHAQHYLIRPKVEHWHPMLYRNADHLFELLVDSGKRNLVLSGHYHVGAKLEAHGSTLFSVCPAFAEFPHPYRIYDLPDDGRCEYREEVPAVPDRVPRLLCIDRANILTHPSVDEAFEFAGFDLVNQIMAKATDVGFVPIMLSSWNDTRTTTLGWTDIKKRHDRLFAKLDSSASAGGGQVLYIDPELAERPNLPDAPISILSPNLPQQIASLFGSNLQSMAFITCEPRRQKSFSDSGVQSMCVKDGQEALGAVDQIARSFQ